MGELSDAFENALLRGRVERLEAAVLRLCDAVGRLQAGLPGIEPGASIGQCLREARELVRGN